MSLKDKAAKINFGSLPAPAADSRPVTRVARTAPGQLMEYAAEQRENLVAEVEELKRKLAMHEGEGGGAARAKQLEAELMAAQTELRQWDGAKGVRLIPASDIVPSPLANRHVLNFSSAEFRQLMEEIKSAGGNVQPVKVRPLSQPKDGAHFELVYGHRRHEACRQLGLPVLALVDNVDDQVMFIEMDRENRTRLDLSPWEQGLMYKRGREMNLFANQREMAEELGVNQALISRAMALAELPEEVVAAFPSPMDLQFRWAKPLTDALAEDRAAVLKRAEELSALKGKLGAAAIFSRLVATDVAENDAETTYDVKLSGKRVATVKASQKGVDIRIEPKLVPENKVGALVKLIEGFLSADSDERK